MFITKLLQNCVYVPKPIRILLDIEEKDELMWKVLQLGDTKIIAIEKNILKGVRVFKTPKKPTNQKGEAE